MSLPTITPERARRLIEEGAVLVDVRGADERARARIPGSAHAPIGNDAAIAPDGARAVIFHCRSGGRTTAHGRALADRAGDVPCYQLEGGIEAWRRAGLDVHEDRDQPIELMRQVQIVAGVLILTGVSLGFAVAPAFFGLSGFVGAGLLFAGTTGWCGMALLLQLMPWNARAQTRTTAA